MRLWKPQRARAIGGMYHMLRNWYATLPQSFLKSNNLLESERFVRFIGTGKMCVNAFHRNAAIALQFVPHLRGRFMPHPDTSHAGIDFPVRASHDAPRRGRFIECAGHCGRAQRYREVMFYGKHSFAGQDSRKNQNRLGDACFAQGAAFIKAGHRKVKGFALQGAGGFDGSVSVGIGFNNGD